MKRWLFNIAAGASLLLCVASAILWVRSYRQADWVYHYWSSDRINIMMISVGGRICCIRNHGGYPQFQNPYNVLGPGPLGGTDLFSVFDTGELRALILA
jgi:hypothetical protein